MRQLKHLIFLTLMCLCCTLQALAGYSGSPSEPSQITAENYSSYGFTASNYSAFVGYYAISSAEELYGFAALVNSGSTSINGVLTADIVVNDSVLNADGSLKSTPTYSWTPIGKSSYAYAGTFDGQGHTISGLYFYNTNSANYPSGGNQIGLIGYANGATIKNVGLVDSYLHGRWRVAGICGYSNGGTITNCWNNSTIVAPGNVSAGIFGEGNNNITACYNLGLIKGGSHIAGISAWNPNGTITGCFNIGTVSGSGSNVASISGYQHGAITNCYYLDSCAVDGSNKVQNGIGIDSQGSTTADAIGKTISATAAEFASGRVTYGLNGGKSDSTVIWYQTIGEDELPVMDNSHSVVYVSAPCPSQLSNTEGVVKEHAECNAIGQCPDCGQFFGYATLIETAAQADSLGLSSSFVGYYAIANAAQLYWFADTVNAGFTSAKGVLVADIVVNYNVLNEDGSLNGTPTYSWTPIGTTSYKFAGTFDGQGHTISGLYFNNENTYYIGLFGYMNGSNATIKNVGVIDSYFNGLYYVGGICGYNEYGKIINCYNTATIYANYSGDSYAGGICGGMSNSSSISNCYNTGNIGGYYKCVAGICGGHWNGTITNCYNTGNIYANAGNNTSNNAYAGGISGWMSNSASISNCHNTGDVEAYGKYAGGIIGYMNNSNNRVTNCYNLGSVKANQYAGGICGYQNNSTVTNNFSTGTISGSSYVGGVIGYKNNGTATNNFALSGTASECKGGQFATAEEFASGKVAYGLNGNTSNSTVVWRQTIGTDSLPVWDTTHAVVYASAPCAGHFSNTEGVVKEHTECNAIGQCSDCGEFIVSPLFVATAGIADSLGLTEDYVGFYAISNAAQLYGFEKLVNGGTTSPKGVLLADIVVNDNVLTNEGELNGTPEFDWTPMGTSQKPYNGTFDGQGHTISGLYFNNTSTSYVGLFGYVSNPTIKNVGLVDSYIKGNEYVGGIAGYVSGSAQITNCHNAATVYANYNGNSDAGGICGYLGSASALIDGCHNTGNVSGYYQYVGGICGSQNQGRITNSYNTGKVYSSAGNSTGNWASAGGISGYMNNTASISNCYNTGDVEGYGYYAGGIIGYMNNSGNQVTNCYNLGSVKANLCSGGICGYQNNGTMTNNFSTGTISGSNYVGGVIGYKNSGTATNNFALKGTATGISGGQFATAEQFAGGMVAYKLNGESSVKPKWFQTIGEDAIPVMDSTHAIVYQSAPCPYTNDTTGVREHNYVDDICTNCGHIIHPELADGWYQIASVGQLLWLADTVNNHGFNTIKARLVADIVLNDSVLGVDGSLNNGSYRIWEPIGNSSYYFNGEFDGQGHTISGVYINGSNSYVGLFGYIGAGKVTNVTLSDSYIAGSQYVGGICGHISGAAQITNCHNSATVYASYAGDDFAGGICGYLNNSSAVISGCSNNGFISVYQRYAGGICGDQNSGTITNSHNNGRIYAAAGNNTSNDAYAGGISGYMNNYSYAVISNCYNNGEVEGYGRYAGGITGRIYGRISNCYNVGAVTASINAGAIYGYNYSANTSNNYALSGSAMNSNGGTFYPGTDFASGKIAYLLNGSVSGGTVWRQTIGTDAYPTLDTASLQVYTSAPCPFSNDTTGVKEHIFDDATGFCTHCGAGTAPELVDGWYEISKAAHLYWLADTVNNHGYTSAKARLVADIVVNDSVLDTDGNPTGTLFRSWTPIGTISYYYRGEFDGQGHTISGLYFNNTSTSYVGLFGYISSPTIKNVGLVDSYLKGNQYVGGIAGYVGGSAQITNCYNAATVYANYNGDSNVGGICGYLGSASALIDGCYNTGYVSGYLRCVGGICGYQYNGTITNSYNTGKVYANAGNNTGNNAYAGGISGYMNNSASISNCYNTGDVEAFGYYAGGIVGYMNYSNNRVTNCYNLGNVKANQYSGGICGYQNYGTTANCFNAGAITANSYAKGIAGNWSSGSLTNCYVLSGSAPDLNNGTSFSTAEEFASGLIAFQLNGSESGASTWRQNLSGTIDSLPILDNTHGLVYMGCDSVFVNDIADAAPHHFVDGVCSVCGVKDTPMLVDGWYEIENQYHLIWFAEQVNSGKANINGKLVADIVLNDSVLNAEGELNGDGSNFTAWTPIGTNNYKFAGTFDGQGHTVSGLYFNNNGASEYPNGGRQVGLFSCAVNATIKNVTVADSYIFGYNRIGGICGFSDKSTITNCHNAATLKGTTDNSFAIGGICGTFKNSSIITGCSNTGIIYGENVQIGGIAGYCDNNCSIANCYNTGNVTGSYQVGGIAGYGCYITNSFNTGNIVGSYNVAAIVGVNGTTTNCYYLDSCAVDGSNKVQNGIGRNSQGYATDDVEGCTIKATADDFASGKVAYSLTGGDTLAPVWHQTLFADAMPVFDTTRNIVAGYAETEGDEIIVHGNLVVATDYVIAEGKTLVVPAGATLTTTNSAVITNNGKLAVDGTLVAASINGAGDFVYRDITDAELSLVSTSVTYKGSEFTLADGLEVEYLTRTAFGKTLTFDAESADVTYSANRNAGTATVVWTVSDAVTISREFTIVPRSLTVTVDSTYSKVYDGTTVATGIISSNKVEGDNLAISYTAAFANANAGADKAVSYSFSVSGSDAANYVLASTTGTGVASISARTGVVVTITGNSGSYTYNGVERSVSGYSVAVSDDLFIYTASDFTFSGSDTVKATNAGTYAMQLKAEDFSNTNANYSGVEFAVINGSLTISKAAEAPNKPAATMETQYVNTQLVELPANWQWSEYKALTFGVNNATALYNGADAGNYITESVDVTITLIGCPHNQGDSLLYVLEPTCTHAGYTGNHCCKLCGEIYEYGDSIPALGHAYDTVVVAPTCTIVGYTQLTCSRCGEVVNIDTVPALGHTPDSIVIENVVAATYTTAGSYDSVVYCSHCGEELSRTTIEVPMLIAAAQKIELKSMPKIEYIAGEKLDVSGAVVVVTFSNGTTKEVALSAAMVSGFDAKKVGEQKLTVTYTVDGVTLTTTFTVKVEKNTAVDDEAVAEVSIYAINRTIVVETAEPAAGYIFVFDANGRLVAKELATSNRTEIAMTRQGLYIVRIGDKAERVVVY